MPRSRKATAKSLLILAFVFPGLRFFPENPYVAGANSEYSISCDELICKIGEQCVTRKFWCNYKTCPSMTYCSGSRKESLKGPENCKSVLCTSGHKCLVRVNDCEWDQKCKQRVARCVSAREFLESPASCVDVGCPAGHLCVLREPRCARPPCRLTRSCARAADVHVWFERCREMGCRSEHDCFLRKPPETCAVPPCGYFPDCMTTTNLNVLQENDETGNDESNHAMHCRGWVCPMGQKCTAQVEAPCRQGEHCHISRFCHEPMMRIWDHPRGKESVINFPPTGLTDIDRDAILEEQRRIQNFFDSTSTTNLMQPAHGRGDFSSERKRDSSRSTSPSHKNLEYAKTKRVPSRPNMPSTSFGDSAWLTYLKRKAGAEAVRFWIEKAKNNEDYEEFIEWLNSVGRLLDPETYRLWLRGLEIAGADVPQFQSWISSQDFGATRRIPGSIDGRPDDRFSGALPSSPPQEFSEFEENSWKTWQSHYPLKPQATHSSPSRYPAQATNMDSYYLNNYTRSRENFSIPPMSSFDNQPKQSQISYLNGQSAFGQLQRPGQQQPYLDELSRKRMVSLPVVGVQTPGRPSYGSGYGPMIDKIAGFQQFTQLQPNIMKLNPNQTVPPLLLSPTSDNDHLPNLLIYFPAPLNFFIYYTAKNQNLTEKFNSEARKFPFGTRTIKQTNNSNENSFPHESELMQKIETEHKQKELKYIRKIIKDLINYWDEDEAHHHDQGSEFIDSKNRYKNQNKFESSAAQSRIIKTAQNAPTVPLMESVQEPVTDNKKPSFYAFLEWLTKNSDFRDEKPRRKGSPVYNASEEHVTVNETVNNQQARSTNVRNAPSYSENTQKIRVFVDIDKNPELMKALFSKNNTSSKNGTDSIDNQVIVNLNEFIDTKEEEDLLSRRLIDLATHQLHRNLSGEQKMPKTLWVFPIYEDEDNDTLINEPENSSNDKVYTLEDVDVPTSGDHDKKHEVPVTNEQDKPSDSNYDYEEEAFYDESLDQST